MSFAASGYRMAVTKKAALCLDWQKERLFYCGFIES
jgi:hypothetical protein